MAKLTEKDRTNIIREYAAGKSVSELAKKFQVSHSAISKILKPAKSCENGEKSCKGKQDNQALAQLIIDKAVAGLIRDIDNAPVRDKLAAIERLSQLYHLEEQKEEQKLEFTFEIRDLTRREDESIGDDS